MAAYDSLKSLVQQAIRTNGNNEITGQVLQNVLMAMIDELGGENGYAGVATPSTNPGAPDGKVFYFATEAGTYTHFDGATLAKGIHLLVFNGVTWSHQTLYTIDSEVTSGSNNLITSGAVYTKIINAINALDATVSKSAGADGLSLSLTETDGKVTSISGSIAPQTYDAYGAASAAQIAASTDATNKVNAAKTQILGDAASDYNTLGKLEDKIQAEASRAAAAESALNTAKADKATTLAGYGINDAYTKTEVNGLVSTPHQNYVTVPTYASLPATGSADTIYRVSNYNGSTSQVDASVYSEYAWNGSGYTFLRVVSQIGEVFDITVYNSNTKYADLAAALGTNGANVPSSIRRGGMSVKFVQSSDNKYVQYRSKTTEFSTNENDWEGEELEISNVPSTNELYLSDKNKNVVLVLKNGHILTRNFNSTESVDKEYVLDVYNALKLLIDQANSQIANKQDKGNYVTYSVGRDNTKVYIKDDEGNVVALIGNGHIKTGKFDSSKSLIQTQKGEENLYFTDLFGNVVAVVKNGDIRTGNFDSKVTRLLAESCYERVIFLEQDRDLEKRKMIPAISWVDDDFDTTRMSYLTIMRNWCNAHNIHGDLALIPDATIVDIPNSEHKDITDVYFKPERLALVQEFENEGFEFLVHPPHYGLYEGGGWNIVETDEYIRKNFAMTVRCFLDNNIYPDILVYPGGSGGVNTVKECAMKYFTCAIIPSGGAVGNPRTSYSSTRYQLPRLPIVISQDNTVTMIKNQIAAALSNNEWVILNSHVWMFSGDGTEATDETSMSFANLFDIITYANTLQKIKPVREVWRTRQILWDYYRNY